MKNFLKHRGFPVGLTAIAACMLFYACGLYISAVTSIVLWIAFDVSRGVLKMYKPKGVF